MFWQEGQQIQPEVKVQGGPFDWQSAPGSTIRQMQPEVLEASLCDIQEDTFKHPEPEDEIPDI